MANWTIADIPSQAGKFAVVTGATGGLGYETALGLAAAGAELVMVGRREQKGRDALAQLMRAQPNARASFALVNLSILAEVAGFADRLLAEGRPIDLLVNNAGVASLMQRKMTGDGFELQFGTNYLSHFALTAQLLPLLRGAREPRVVSVSSIAHRHAAIRFDDLNFSKTYRGWPAYGQSKLAMLMFALELQRRSDAHGWGLRSIPAHPGFARTDLIVGRAGSSSLISRLTSLIMPFTSQSAAAGALPILFAATAPEARGGCYYGPDGMFELKGRTAPAFVSARAKDEAAARRLWEVSEELTGVRWPSA